MAVSAEVLTRTGGTVRLWTQVFQSVLILIRVTGLCSTLDLHLRTSALETGYLGELQLGSAERAARAVLTACTLSLGPARLGSRDRAQAQVVRRRT